MDRPVRQQPTRQSVPRKWVFVAGAGYDWPLPLREFCVTDPSFGPHPGGFGQSGCQSQIGSIPRGREQAAAFSQSWQVSDPWMRRRRIRVDFAELLTWRKSVIRITPTQVVRGRALRGLKGYSYGICDMTQASVLSRLPTLLHALREAYPDARYELNWENPPNCWSPRSWRR